MVKYHIGNKNLLGNNIPFAQERGFNLWLTKFMVNFLNSVAKIEIKYNKNIKKNVKPSITTHEESRILAPREPTGY